MRTVALVWQKRKMVVSCCVVGCTNRFVKGGDIKLFRFPCGKAHRRAWIRALNRKNFVPKEHSRVCSVHFVSGWPDYVDPADVDYAPSVFRYKQKPVTPLQKKRCERNSRRSIAKAFEEAATMQRDYVEKQLQTSVHFHDYFKHPEETTDTTDMALSETDEDMQLNVIDSEHMDGGKRNTGTMTDNDIMTELQTLKAENDSLKLEIQQLKKELKERQWSCDKICGDDKATQFYTGLPTYAVFLWLFRYLESKASRMTYWTGSKKTKERERRGTFKLNLMDQLLSVLMRLKVGLFVKDVADRFNISVGTYSKIFNTWIILLQTELAVLFPYPSRELVSRYMPQAFHKYPTTRIILDCTEIYVERPSALSAQNQTFSNYKHHNTLKFLVGISPGGVFTFLSEAWGGRVSDKEIVKSSGILDLIEPGDNVMADKGFTIDDLLTERGATLNIPPFLSQASQFTKKQVQETRDIAEVRIHVERAIGRLKNFHLLDGTLPLSLQPCISEIVHVCAYLTNLNVPITSN